MSATAIPAADVSPSVPPRSPTGSGPGGSGSSRRSPSRRLASSDTSSRAERTSGPPSWAESSLAARHGAVGGVASPPRWLALAGSSPRCWSWRRPGCRCGTRRIRDVAGALAVMGALSGAAVGLAQAASFAPLRHHAHLDTRHRRAVGDRLGGDHRRHRWNPAVHVVRDLRRSSSPCCRLCSSTAWCPPAVQP